MSYFFLLFVFDIFDFLFIFAKIIIIRINFNVFFFAVKFVDTHERIGSLRFQNDLYCFYAPVDFCVELSANTKLRASLPQKPHTNSVFIPFVVTSPAF